MHTIPSRSARVTDRDLDFFRRLHEWSLFQLFWGLPGLGDRYPGSKESNGEGLKRKPKSSASAWFGHIHMRAAPQIIFWEAARYVLRPTAFFSGFCSAKIAAPATTASSAIIEKNASFDIFS